MAKRGRPKKTTIDSKQQAIPEEKPVEKPKEDTVVPEEKLQN